MIYRKNNIVAENRSKLRKAAKCRAFGCCCSCCEHFDICTSHKKSETLYADEALDLKLAAEAEAKRLADEQKATAEAEAKRLAEEQKATAEAEAKRLADEQKAAAEAEAKRLAEEQKEEPAQEVEAEPVKTEEVKTEEKGFKLDPKENADVLPAIATKRGRKLIYAPKEAIYEATGIQIDVNGKKNDKGVKVKDILDAEIKEGLKLGYLEKYDGLKTAEIKEEYENDTVWELAEQEFKKMGLLLDGDKVKVYLFDWTGTGCHHVGYLPDDKAAELRPYLEKIKDYSFDVLGIITGGKSKTVTKDPTSGKISITKGKDGNYGIDLDVTVLNRKD